MTPTAPAAATLALLLAACGGQEPPRQAMARAAPPELQAAPAARPAATAVLPLRVGYVEYLQADAGAPGARRYQAVQIVLELEQQDARRPALELQAAGRVLGRLALARPASGTARYGAGHWSATIPAGWAIAGLSWRAVADNHGASAPQAVPLAD